MAVTKNRPNTIHLGGPITIINHVVAIEAITPGMLLEYHNDSDTLKWGVHDSADEHVQTTVALEQDFMNLGVDDAYAAGDLVVAGALTAGSTFWGIIPSGQNISPAALLQSNGDGKLKADSTGEGRFRALESSGGAVTADTRLRVEVI